MRTASSIVWIELVGNKIVSSIGNVDAIHPNGFAMLPDAPRMISTLRWRSLLALVTRSVPDPVAVGVEVAVGTLVAAQSPCWLRGRWLAVAVYWGVALASLVAVGVLVGSGVAVVRRGVGRFKRGVAAAAVGVLVGSGVAVSVGVLVGRRRCSRLPGVLAAGVAVSVGVRRRCVSCS